MSNPPLEAELDALFAPLFDDLLEQASVADAIVDRDRYRILVATLWVNVVLRPASVGLEESHLEPLHDVLNRRVEQVLGPGESIKSCFRFLNGRDGEQAMQTARLTPEHKDMLLYFASMILDPEGHRQWMEQIRRSRSR